MKEGRGGWGCGGGCGRSVDMSWAGLNPVRSDWPRPNSIEIHQLLESQLSCIYIFFINQNVSGSPHPRLRF